MIKKFYGVFFFIFIGSFLLTPFAHAGFGITPPYVRNTSLTRNSVYEQQILMVRSEAQEALKATITIDAPLIEDWIEIIEGDSIPLPSGLQKVPLTVRVTVPPKADFERYTGKIRIKTGAPDDQVTPGAVSISLGAQVDIDLTVIDKKIFDFRIRKVGISDLNEGHKIAWLYFPGKIKFNMLTENTGNVDVAPTNVKFKIYDQSGTVLLEEIDKTNKIQKVSPFATTEIQAELPTRLPAGTYLARYSIYNDEEIKQEGELTLSILPTGSLQTAGYGFFGLSIPHKISVILPVLTLLLLMGLAFRSNRRKKSKS